MRFVFKNFKIISPYKNTIGQESNAFNRKRNETRGLFTLDAKKNHLHILRDSDNFKNYIGLVTEEMFNDSKRLKLNKDENRVKVIIKRYYI